MSVLETVGFRLVEGVSDARFEELTATLERDFMRGLPGFRSRRTGRDADGDWLVLVEWASAADADAAAALFQSSVEGKAYLAAVDAATMRFGRFELLGEGLDPRP